MEIKRKIEIFTAVKRRYVIRQSSAGKEFPCAACGEPMLNVEQAARIFGIAQRRIFQIIETEMAHFIETETGAAMICLSSLASFLEEERKS